MKDTALPRPLKRALTASVTFAILSAALLFAAPGVAAAAPAENTFATITGTLVGETPSAPAVPGVAVTLVAFVNCNNDVEGCPGSVFGQIYKATTTSSSTGAYSFSAVPVTSENCVAPGAGHDDCFISWTLSAPRTADHTYFASSTHFDPTDGTVANLEMHPASSISGVVTQADDQATPLSGLTVTVQPSSGFAPASAVTDSRGRYSIHFLQPGAYAVSLQTSAFNVPASYTVPLGSAETITNANFSLKPLTVVTGFVSSTTSPTIGLAGIVVRTSGTGTASTTTDASGMFVFPKKFVGGTSNSLTYSDPAGNYGQQTVSFTAVAGQNIALKALLVQGGHITGTVLRNGPTPAGLPGVLVKAVQRSTGLTVSTSTGGIDGRYDLPAVPPGAYSVQFLPPTGFVAQTWPRASGVDTGRLITVASGHTVTGIDALIDTSLTLGGVSGTVTLLATPVQAAPGATVTITSPDAVRTFTATTDSAGKYSITGVPSGDYTAKFVPASTAYLTQWYGGSTTEAGSTSITVSQGRTRTATNIALAKKKTFGTAPAPTISGTFNLGSTLTLGIGTWSPTPDSYTYEWRRNGVPIVGATAKTYILTASDVEAIMSVNVTATKGADYLQTRGSRFSGTVTNVLTSAPTPTIVGTAVAGQTLLVSTLAWSPAPVGLTFQWKRDYVNIAGATGTGYRLTTADRGHKITVTVTGTKPGFISQYHTSAAVSAK